MASGDTGSDSEPIDEAVMEEHHVIQQSRNLYDLSEWDVDCEVCLIVFDRMNFAYSAPGSESDTRRIDKSVLLDTFLACFVTSPHQCYRTGAVLSGTLAFLSWLSLGYFIEDVLYSANCCSSLFLFIR
ncbi:unnamed protein product [Gongylonema pulchrum]|uniref:Autophagy-related protein 9 n=1 Tax=Gongylonema pulchrum TaxID=637853 RepID=A0A183DE05_9BILA|nr:unnamed protein product [Gongylonema pulchrum]